MLEVAVVNLGLYDVEVTSASVPTPSDHIASRIKEVRASKGWSTKTLAQRCAEFGAPQLTASVLMNIEHGRPGPDGRRRRNITADELLALAYAMDLHPLALLLPGNSTDYALTPTVSVSVEDAYRWFAGQLEHRPEPDADMEPTVEDEEEAWKQLRGQVPWLPKSALAAAYEQLRKDYDQVRDRMLRFLTEGGNATLQANYYRNWFKSNGIEDPLEHQAENDRDDECTDVVQLDTKRESVESRQRVTRAAWNKPDADQGKDDAGGEPRLATRAARRDPDFNQGKSKADDEPQRVKTAARKRPKDADQGKDDAP